MEVNVDNNSWRKVKGILICDSTRDLFFSSARNTHVFHHHCYKKRNPAPSFPKLRLLRTPPPSHCSKPARNALKNFLCAYTCRICICLKLKVGPLLLPPIADKDVVRFPVDPCQLFWATFWVWMLEQIRGNPPSTTSWQFWALRALVLKPGMLLLLSYASFSGMWSQKEKPKLLALGRLQVMLSRCHSLYPLSSDKWRNSQIPSQCVFWWEII